VVVAAFSGEGGQNTPTFTVAGPWEVRWSSTGMLDLYLHDADGRILRNIVTQWQAGDGVLPHSEGGTFFFDVNLGDRWTIEVVGPPPAAAPAAPLP
jgi:hypothetical protein